MKYFKLLSLLVIVFMLATLWGCSGNSPNQTQSGKSVGRIILPFDKGVVTDTGDQGEPSVAYDPTTQTFLTVFTSVNSTLNITEIKGTICAGYPKAQPAYQNNTDPASTAGMACGSTFSISDQNVVGALTSPGNKTQPKVAFDSNSKKYLVAWTDSRNGTYSQIYGQYLKTDPAFLVDHVTLSGAPLKKDGVTSGIENFMISPHDVGLYTSQSQPDVIYNSVLQKFVLAWVDTSTFDNNRIKGASVTQKAKWVANDSFIVNGSNDPTQFQVNRTSGVGILVNNTDYTIVASGPQNVTVTIKNSLLPDTLTGTSDSLSIVYTPTTGSPTITTVLPKWHTNDSVTIPQPADSLPADKVYLIMDVGIYNGGLVPVTGQTLFNGSSINGALNVPLLGSSAVGTSNFITVYRTVNNLVFESVQGGKCSNAVGPILYVPVLMADNNLIRSAEVDVAGNVTNTREVSPLLSTGFGAVDISGKINATWSGQFNESRPKIAFNTSTGENYVAWSGINKNIDMNIAYTLNIDQTSCSYEGALFTATDTDNGRPKIKLRRNQGLGLVKDYSFGTGSAFYPALATDPNTNRLLLVWEDDQSIIGQLVDLTSFTSYGPSIAISAKSTVAGVNDPRTSPVVAFDNANQRFLTVWEDARNQSANLSNIDIYGQFIDPQGNLSGGNTVVTVANGNQLSPTISFGDVNYRKFIVNWKDGRTPSDADIFGQIHEFSLGPQLALYTRDDAGNLTPLLNGALNFGSINVGLTVDKTLVLKNDGNVQLTVNGIKGVDETTAGPDAPYSLLTPKPVTINPGTTYDLGLRFAPFASGSYADPSKNFGITIDSNGGKAVVYFSGAGTGFNPLNITSSVLPDASPGLITDPPYTFALLGTGGVYPYTWNITGMPPSFVISRDFNSATGVISWAPQAGDVSAIPYTVTISLQDNSSPKGLVKRDLQLRVGTISITTDKLQTWGMGQPYDGANQILEATANGVKSSNYTWSISKGTLPTGMSFSSTIAGKLVGTPTVSGTFTFTIRAASSATVFAEREFTLTINPKPAILTTSLPLGIIGKNYNYAITMTGGTAPFAWSGSAMPPGLTFSSGVIFGTPTASGTQIVSVTITDATGATATFSNANGTLPLTINDTLDIKTPTTGIGSPPNGTAGAFYSFTFDKLGGIAPYTWSVVNGVLPSGLSLVTSSGGLSGTLPDNTAGSYSFNLQLQDSSGSVITKTYNLTVAPPLKVSTNTLSPWTINSGNYSQELIATGGAEPYSWSWQGNPIQTVTPNGTVTTPGPLPDGLSLTSAIDSFGKTHWYISGTPSKAGSFQLLMKVADGNNASATSVVNLQINSDMVFTTTNLPSGTDGILYVQQLIVAGGTAPFSWTVSGGSLPTNLILDKVSGLISGIPATNSTTATTFKFTVTASDASGAKISKSLEITISPSLSIDAVVLPQVSLNVSYNQTLTATGGRVPYTWSISTGSLPTGLDIAPATGVISGTVIAPGTYNFVARVVDADSIAVNRTFSITVGGSGLSPLSISTTTINEMKVNAAVSFTMQAAGGSGGYSWAVTGGAFPAGVTLNTDGGTVAGTPTQAGNYSVVIQASDIVSGNKASRLYLFSVTDPGTSTTNFLNFADQTNAPLSNNTLALGSALKSTTVSKQFNLLNGGSSSVSIASVTFSDPAFTAVLPIGSSIAPGAANAITVRVNFVPLAAKDYSATMTIKDSTGANSVLNLLGTGTTVNVVLEVGSTGTVTSFTSLTPDQLPISAKPATFSVSSAAQMRVDGMTTGGTVNVNAAFETLPANPVFYNVNGNVWTLITPTPTVSGTTATFAVTDTSALDADPANGAVVNTLVVGTTGTGGGTGGGTTTTGGSVSSSSGGGSSSGCFIATAAYGSYLDPHVMVLRHFRDNVLLQSESGTAFVKFYYKYSPPVADFIAEHDSLRMVMRLALTPLIFAVKYPLFAALLFVCVGALLIRRRVSVVVNAETVQQAG